MVPDAPRFADAAPPASRPVPALSSVEGASVEAGRALFAKQCVACHGADGRGGEATGPLPPTDLTAVGFLCQTTIRGGATDADLESAMGRGSHRFPKLDAPARRSLALFLRRLRPPAGEQALLDIPAETPDTPADRARGRVLYLAFGCWRCHGPSGAGDGTAVKFLAWNRRSLTKLRPLAERGALCGDAPERLYQTIALGLGGQPALMPRYLETLEAASLPKESPETWGKALAGVVPEEEVAAVRAFYAELPAKAEAQRMPVSEKRRRAAAMTWSIVHWLRILPTP